MSKEFAVPGFSELGEPGGDVSSHDDQWILQLSVGLCCQFTVDILTGGNDFLTCSILTQRYGYESEKKSCYKVECLF